MDSGPLRDAAPDLSAIARHDATMLRRMARNLGN
jgi:hypothetical protein